MSTLYIRHPSQAATEKGMQTCAFALATEGKAIEREGIASLTDLAALIREARRVVVLVAASDLNLLRLKVPPLSPAKLRLALPNLIEDQILSDPAECVIVAGPESSSKQTGLRTVAVAQRGWLAHLVSSLTSLGAHRISLLPAQLCLPCQPNLVCAGVQEQNGQIELAIRLADHEGIGMTIIPQNNDTVAQEVLQTLRAIAPEASIHIYVPQARVNAFQALADTKMTVASDNWMHAIAEAKTATLDLMMGLIEHDIGFFNWRYWRWPLTLVALLLLVNVVSLNVSWWYMQSEADALQDTMLQTFRSIYPNENVIIDPVAQMQQKIAATRSLAGQFSPDDFTSLGASFGEAWRNTSLPGERPAISKLLYQNRSLLVHFTAGASAADEQVKRAFSAHQLQVEQIDSNVWRVRSGK